MSLLLFNRYEKKYLITMDVKKQLEARFQDYLAKDSYSKDSAYSIYNIYFDTFDYEVIRHSLSKPKYKSKLRLRFYEYPVLESTDIYLEMKHKSLGQVHKRRQKIHFDGYQKLLKSGLYTVDSPTQIDNEIMYYLKHINVLPSTFLLYERTAWQSENNILRITFDINMKTAPYSEKGLEDLTPIIDEDMVIMEIKSSMNFPFWLVRILSELNIKPTRFSKYGRAYQNTLGGYNG